ncbi:intracellular hyaluronan-binding protein 4 isoform X2 [Latimeria chalumnae]|uniref:intracellular hyaluronan-binding protein 4 isoform X2 n=1 Tax=Latimeria chalumnae TaxID=7897 RepID=UPI0003C1B332|nr:PREDICTED: intracellular hyaluronan-binding protein 4 isoform X2 [Latimeria chalumnae]|eukprot:XP_006001953.1 PREDICTED: intracellular hyaluronan-binding protein 4 isoform X2 [Latimeria chalumnae]
MKGVLSSPVSAAMQDSFGCAVTNRFDQLLDDESDPFDILREATELDKKKKKKKKDEAAGVAKRGGGGSGAGTKSGGGGSGGGGAGAGKRESQKERKILFAEIRPGGGENVLSTGFSGAGQKRFSKKEVPASNENSRTPTRMERTEWRSAFREYRPSDAERPTEFMENETDQNVRAEEVTETEEAQETPEGDTENRTIEVEPVEETQHEMTLDEWKLLQEQNRVKTDFNIRKPDTCVPSKAVVIHKSRYQDGELKEENEDDYHCFRKATNDITSKLDINFGSLPRPGRGSRGGGRGGRGRARRTDGARPEVTQTQTQVNAPDPDDPEAFPALA